MCVCVGGALILKTYPVFIRRPPSSNQSRKREKAETGREGEEWGEKWRRKGEMKVSSF